MARAAFVLLPGPLIIAAALSQFSASVADTVAGAANLEEASRRWLPAKWGYVVIGVGASAQAWTASPLQTVAIASRAFAFYYLMQCVVAYAVCRNRAQRVRGVVIGLLLAFVLLFAVPVG